MDWTLTRRILMAAFLALDVFLLVLIRQNAANSALPQTGVTLPRIGASAVRDPLPVGDHVLPTIALHPLQLQPILIAVFATVPEASSTANGTLYARQNTKVLLTPGGHIVVTLPLPPDTTITGSADAQNTAEILLGEVGSPILTAPDVTRTGKTYTLVYQEAAQGVPLFGARATVTITAGRPARLDMRLFLTERSDTQSSILPADEAVTYFVAAGGSPEVKEVSLGYPTPTVTQSEAQVAPVWRITTERGVVDVNAYTGENLP